MVQTPAITSNQPELQTFRAPATKWWQAAGFLFMLSMIGLRVYPILLAVIIIIVWRWRSDRYAFVVEAMILVGSFGFIPIKALPMPSSDIGMIIGIIGFIIYRKNKIVRRVSLATLAYFLAVFLIAMTSLESLSVQVFRMRNYFAIITFFIPLITFANRSFEWDKFREAVVVHTLMICGFYVIDTYIIGGFILIPGVCWGGIESTFYNPYISGFMSLPRHYPPGLYWLLPCVLWLNHKKLKFSAIQWIIIALALFAARTNSMLFALMVCWIFARPNIKKIFSYSIIACIALTAGYFIDDATGRNLRLADNIDQFTSLQTAQDEEDLAEFGTGRMAQIIPKWILLDDMNRIGLGFGFIHPTKTTNPIFMIRNEFYSDVSRADEIATEVEETHVQTIFDIGVIGLIIQTLFYVGIYLIIRRLKHSQHYLNVLIGVSVLGFGGFAGLNNAHGLVPLATMLGAILLANKPQPQVSTNTQDPQ